MTFVGLVVPADGTTPYRMTFGDDPQQRPGRIVGGYIELVHGPLGLACYCNEDGKAMGLPVNRRATELFRPMRALGYSATLNSGAYVLDDIVGDVVVFDNMSPALETADEGDAPEWLDDRI